MKLAQCIILDLLKDYDPVPILPETCDFHFSGVQLLDQDNPTDDPSILYIGTTTQISSFDTEKLKDFCIIRKIFGIVTVFQNEIQLFMARCF